MVIVSAVVLILAVVMVIVAVVAVIVVFDKVVVAALHITRCTKALPRVSRQHVTQASQSVQARNGDQSYGSLDHDAHAALTLGKLPPWSSLHRL